MLHRASFPALFALGSVSIAVALPLACISSGDVPTGVGLDAGFDADLSDTGQPATDASTDHAAPHDTGAPGDALAEGSADGATDAPAGDAE